MENARKGMGDGKGAVRHPLRRPLQNRINKPALTRKS
jgi:hypothetical protein